VWFYYLQFTFFTAEIYTCLKQGAKNGLFFAHAMYLTRKPVMRSVIFYTVVFLLSSCIQQPAPVPQAEHTAVDTIAPVNIPVADTAASPINSKHTTRDELVDFAATLKGVPYHEAGTDPATGFDCSGFITYVFNHFGITVPRSSVDFTNVGREVPVQDARKGDLILFTGTDSTVRIVGHMGIVTENTDSLRFIHSTSGRQYSVTVTALNEYYKGRFVKVIDIW
jgi:cell wall-associated NlpC family hydrolase